MVDAAVRSSTTTRRTPSSTARRASADRCRPRHRPAAGHLGRHPPPGARDDQGLGVLAQGRARQGRAPRARARASCTCWSRTRPCTARSRSRSAARRTTARNIAGFEELVVADPSLQIKSGVQWGLFGSAILQLGTEGAPREVAARRHGPLDPRRVRDDRDRPRLRCRRRRHDRDLRPRDRGVRHPHAVPRGDEGVPRQRGPARRRRDRVRAADHERREPRRALLLRAAARRGRRRPARHRPRGRRPQGRPQRHRQRPPALRPRPHPAHQPAQPLRRRRRRRHLLQRDRQPRPPLLHDARHAGAGARLARRRGIAGHPLSA